MEAALAHSWPGNTRELISVAGELAHSHAAEPRCGLPHFVRISQHKAEPQPPRRSAGGSTDLERTLRQHNYQLNATARALGVGLATLRRRMSALGIVRAQDLEAEAIQAALTEHGESEAAAAALRVSHHGLKVRMRELGL
jgi:transcriptional regulator with PAS, ATPase and Fis domain